MRYLLDTNAVSDAMAEHPIVLAHIGALAPFNRLVTCTIVMGEVLFGIERVQPGARRRALADMATSVFDSATCEPVPPDASQLYAQLKCHREKVGRPMGENDLWIAATAIALGAILVTRDQDFRLIPGLVGEDWTV